MVSTKNEEVLGILDLVREEEANSLETLLATVDVIAQEEIIRLGREATVLEQTQQVVVLSVDVTANLDGCLKLQENGLADENLTRLGAEELHLVLSQVHLLAGAAATNWKLFLNSKEKEEVRTKNEKKEERKKIGIFTKIFEREIFEIKILMMYIFLGLKDIAEKVPDKMI